MAIRNLLHANSCVYSRRLIAEFPEDGIKRMQKFQSHCANMTSADKSRYDRTFQQVTHKGGESAINYIKRFQNAQALSVLVGICTTLTAKLLMTAFKLKMIRFKLDEDPLQRRIYFLVFIDSLNMVFPQYRETYEVLIDYPKMEGGNVKDYAKPAIRNLLHANSCVHSRRLIAEFP